MAVGMPPGMMGMLPHFSQVRTSPHVLVIIMYFADAQCYHGREGKGEHPCANCFFVLKCKIWG